MIDDTWWDAAYDWYLEHKPSYYCPHMVIWTGEPFDTIGRRICDAFGVPDLIREERWRNEE